nr:hypothetical protein CFP56_38097 [Quercus suber]
MRNLGKKQKKSHHFPILVTELYSSLLNEGLIALIVPKPVTNLPKGYHPSKTCEEVKAIMREMGDCLDPKDLHGYPDSLFMALVDLGYIRLKELKEQGSTGLPTAPYPHRVAYPSLLLNKGNPGSDISQSSGIVALDLLSVPLSMLLPILLKAKLVELMASEIQPKLVPETYDSESHCGYHGLMIGHSTDMCELLKQKVLGFIKGGWLEPEVYMSSSSGELDIHMFLTRKSRPRIAPRKLELICPGRWTAKPCFSRAHLT